MAELREALESAITQAEETAAAEPQTVPESASAPEPVSQESTVDTPPDGVEKSDEAPKADIAEKPATPNADEKPVEKKPETEEEKRQHRIDRAPQAWKKEAKGEWNNLPLHIRQEVHKREAEITRVLNQTAPDRQLAEQFKQTVQPFMARIQANGVNPLQAVEGLFKADLMLATASKADRAKYMADLIKQYDVDIEALDNALVGNAQPLAMQQSPDIAALVQQQLNQALAPILQREQQQKQQRQEQVTQTVEQMSLNPDYPYFDDVRDDMADIIEINAKRGVAISLEEAYSRAVRMNPETAGLIERQHTMQTAEQKHLQAQRVKVAASSVTGAPAGAGSQQHVGDGSLRGAIEAAFGGQRM